MQSNTNVAIRPSLCRSVCSSSTST